VLPSHHHAQLVLVGAKNDVATRLGELAVDENGLKMEEPRKLAERVDGSETTRG
jgi:hypothetical protein